MWVRLTDSITFNDQIQSLIQAGTVVQTQFAWASDVPTGNVVLGQSAHIISMATSHLYSKSFVPMAEFGKARYCSFGIILVSG